MSCKMNLLGWVTFIYVSYSSNPQPGSVTTHTKTSWQVNGFWTGGYEDTCRWHADLLKVVKAEPLPLVTTLLEVLFAVLAIGVKLRVVASIYEPMPSGPEEPGDAGPGTGGARQTAVGGAAATESMAAEERTR